MPDRRKGTSLINLERRSGVDRRRSSRYLTAPLVVSLAWEDGDQRGAFEGGLQDLSVAGASLLSFHAPPRGAKVMLGLESEPEMPRIEATVVRIAKTRRFLPGPFLICLRFAAPCPYEFFTRAVFGA